MQNSRINSTNFPNFKDTPLYVSKHFIPAYRSFLGENWQIINSELQLCPGYWSPVSLIRNMPALIRRNGDEVHTWMSMSPMEIESQEIGCDAAVGRTVIMGMGMGWAAANTALREEVTEVTVVEYDKEVIKLIEFCGVFEQLPPDAAAKIKIVNGDAYTYVPDLPVDTLLADIWQPLFGADRDAEVRGMRDNTRASRVYFWGQEMVLAYRAQRRGLPINHDTVAALTAETGLPLIGPETPDYPQKIAAAAAKWLKA